MIEIKKQIHTISKFLNKNPERAFLFLGFLFLFSIYLPANAARQSNSSSSGFNVSYEDTTRNKVLSVDEMLEMDIEELMNVKIRSVGFFETDQRYIPGSAYVLKEDGLELVGTFTLEQMVDRHIPGSLTGRHGFSGSLHGVRGLLIDNNAKTMAMFDGENINQRSYRGYSNGFQIPLNGDLDRIEFVNGPGSIVHGSGAINGYVNMIPKNGTQNAGLEINAGYGFQEKFGMLETGYGKNYGKHKDIFIYGGIAIADGFKGDENNYNFDFDSFNPNLSGSLVNKVLNYHIHNYEKPSLKFSTNWNHDNLNMQLLFTSHHSASNTYVHPGFWRTRSLLWRTKYIFELNDLENLEFNISTKLFDDNFHRIEMQGEIVNEGEIFEGGGRESNIHGKILFKSERIVNNKLAAGVSINNRTFEKQKQYFSESLPYSFNIVNTDWIELGFFAENSYKLTNKILLIGGLRYDLALLNDIDGEDLENQNNISPLAAITYQIFPNTFIKFKYQTGFRYPDAGYYERAGIINLKLRELGYTDKKITLKPEYLQSYEFNIISKLQDLNINWDLNIYYNQFHNTLSYVFYEAEDEYLNLPQIDVDIITTMFGFQASSMNNLSGYYSIYGGEIHGNIKLTNTLNLASSYSFAENDNLSPQSVRYPKHIVKSNINQAVFKKRLLLNLNLLWYSGFDTDKNGFNKIYSNDRFVLDASAQLKVTRLIQLQFILKNLLATNVPPIVFDGNPNRGGLGFDRRFAYIFLKVQLPTK